VVQAVLARVHATLAAMRPVEEALRDAPILLLPNLALALATRLGNLDDLLLDLDRLVRQVIQVQGDAHRPKAMSHSGVVLGVASNLARVVFHGLGEVLLEKVVQAVLARVHATLAAMRLVE